MMICTARLERALEHAVRAPSVHNTQPWRWQLQGDAIELFADFDHQQAWNDRALGTSAHRFGAQLVPTPRVREAFAVAFAEAAERERRRSARCCSLRRTPDLPPRHSASIRTVGCSVGTKSPPDTPDRRAHRMAHGPRHGRDPRSLEP